MIYTIAVAYITVVFSIRDCSTLYPRIRRSRNCIILAYSLVYAAAAAAKSLQSCPPLCDPIDGSPPCSAVPGILQARTLEWVAIPFSNAWKWKVNVKSLSRVRLLATPWTAVYQAPLSMGFSRQDYWNRLPRSIKQWELTQRKPLEYKTWHHPATLCRTPHSKQAHCRWAIVKKKGCNSNIKAH